MSRADDELEAVAGILRRVDRPKRYAGDWEADTARRILDALADVAPEDAERLVGFRLLQRIVRGTGPTWPVCDSNGWAVINWTGQLSEPEVALVERLRERAWRGPITQPSRGPQTGGPRTSEGVS